MHRKNRRNKKKKTNKTMKTIKELTNLFIIDDDEKNDADDDDDDANKIDIDNIHQSSIEYLCSYLLICTISNNNDDRDMINYICHPTVIYKLACMVQLDCIKLENQISNIKYTKNLFFLLELITRKLPPNNKNNKKNKNNNNDLETEKQGLLKILDCIGLSLRFAYKHILNDNKSMSLSVSSVMMDCDDDDDDDVDMVPDNDLKSIQISNTVINKLLTLILKVLTNVTNGRNVTLKPDTMCSIFIYFQILKIKIMK